MTDLLAVESHFSFGENWKSFVSIIDRARMDAASISLNRLFPNDELKDVEMIDIGCGSGLSTWSAVKLGAKHVDCVDIDQNSVDAASMFLSRHLPVERWSVRKASVFEIKGSYDVVYSWGVLHHTGDMWGAIKHASSLVAPGGKLCIALYGKGRLCGFWRQEKKFYTQSPRVLQWLIRSIYKAVWFAYFVCRGRNPFSFIRNYGDRGMDWSHDVHDWLGGYPYESATPTEVEAFLKRLNFSLVRSFTSKPNLTSGCDEYVAVRTN